MKLSLRNIIGAKELALVLILYSNICFYNLNTQIVYILMNLLAGVLVFVSSCSSQIRITKGFVWLSAVFSLFVFYGLFYLQTGIFNIDRYLISYYQCILYYIIFTRVLSEEQFDKKLSISFMLAAFLCILTMRIQEGSFIGRELRSVGSSLSGNVNTVGMGLGIMSLFMVYYYGKTKKISILAISCIIMLVMMLTGSKNTIIYIIANIYIIYSFSKNKTVGKILLISLFSGLAFLVFGVEYFYNLIGSRVIDMLGQMGFRIINSHYSHSTEVRIYMIQEAIELWLRHPLIGGGTYYFWANTKTLYEYSHCNVTELLCSFGIIGFVLFYMPHVSYIRRYKSIKKAEKNLATFGLICVVLSLIIDWMAVTYSGFSTMYIPIIFSIAIKEKSRNSFLQFI